MEISALIGKTLTDIQVKEDEIYFTDSEGTQYVMCHFQDCCESVTVEDIVGDINDLLNTPILKAEESMNDENPCSGCTESHTWTFYRLATIKGYVTIRWYGESNGYYSERVEFGKLSDKNYWGFNE